MKRLIISVALGLLLVGCSWTQTVTQAPASSTPQPSAPRTTQSSQPTAQPTRAEPSASPAPTPSAERSPTAEIELTITGGPHAGSYRGVAEGDEGCLRNSPAPGQFSVSYSDDAAADGFTSLALTVRDPAAAEEDETDNFLVTVHIKSRGGDGSYTIDPVTGQGDGLVFLETFEGSGTTIVLEGQTEDGVEIQLSVICNGVRVLGGSSVGLARG